MISRTEQAIVSMLATGLVLATQEMLDVVACREFEGLSGADTRVCTRSCGVKQLLLEESPVPLFTSH